MNDNDWRNGMLLLGAVLACAACAPADKEVGSACTGGVCLAAPLEGPTCIATAQIAEIAVTNAPEATDVRLGSVCLGREYPKDARGKIDCKVWWTFPAEQKPGMPSRCSDLPFLSPSPDETTCLVDQVPAPTVSEPSADGWFYQKDNHDCAGGPLGVRTAVAFTEGALPPDVTVEMLCSDVSIAGATDAGTSDSGTTDAVCVLPPDSAEHSSAVGDPCTLHLPETFALESEVYVQTDAAECETGVCIGFHLRGDPSRVCDEDDVSARDECVSASELEQRVYCSCRCDAPADSADACECPDEFSCVDALPDGPIGLRGRYCVRDSTTTTNPD